MVFDYGGHDNDDDDDGYSINMMKCWDVKGQEPFFLKRSSCFYWLVYI